MDPNKIAVRIQAIIRATLSKEYAVRIVAYRPNSMTQAESGIDFEIHHRDVAGRVGGFAVDSDGKAYRLEANFGETRNELMLRKTASIRTYVRSVVNYAIEQTYNELSQQEAA